MKFEHNELTPEEKLRRFQLLLAIIREFVRKDSSKVTVNTSIGEISIHHN